MAARVTRRAVVSAAAGSVALAACGPLRPTAGGEVSSQRPAKISVVLLGGGAQLQITAQIPSAFRTKYPQIELEELTGVAGEKLMAMVVGGAAPDVLGFPAEYGAAGGVEDFAGLGVLLKLDSRLKQDRAFNWDDFWPFARAAGQYDAAQLFLPESAGVTASLLYYNKDLFAAGGQATPDARFQRGQWTWEALLETATRLTKREPTGELVQAGLGYPWFPRYWMMILLRNYGADYMNADGTRVVMGSPQGVHALRVAYELGSRRKTMPMRGEGDSGALMRAGQVAQGVYWTAAAAWMRTTPFDWDVVPTPSGPAPHSTFGIVRLMAISGASKEPDAAWTYVTFALSPEIDLDQAASFGNLVLRQSNLAAWRQRITNEKVGSLSMIEAAVKALRLASPRRSNPRLREVDALFQREIQALLYDGKPPEQVALTVTTEGNALLGR